MRRYEKKLQGILVCLLIAAMLIGFLPANVREAKAASDAVINVNTEYQEIKGFGGMNHPLWAGDLTTSQRETAFGNGENELGFSILRIYIDGNSNNWYREVATAKAAIANGALVFATPWNPPSDMIETFNRNGDTTATRLKASRYADYAQHLNNFVTFMKNNGVDLYAISIANEPDYGHGWIWWTPTEIVNFLKGYSSAIKCRIIAPESFSYNKSMSDPILNDSTALSKIDILGTHLYGTSFNNFAYPLFKTKAANKQLWMTEVYYPNSTSDADTWPEALDVSDHMHNAMVNNFQTYVWWYIRRFYGPMKENGTMSKRGYCMAQYSKFVRRGYKRVDATETPNTNVSVSAYKGDGKVVIVAINKGTSGISQKFTVSNQSIANVDRYRTSSNENLAKTSNLALTGTDGFWAYLPANSVTTFECTMNTSAGSTVTLGDGWYYIKNPTSGNYLQVTNNAGNAGQNVEVSSKTGKSGERWYLSNTENGYFTLTNGLGAFMLDVAGGAASDNTNIIIYNGYGGNAQQFSARASSVNGRYGIMTRASNGSSGLHIRMTDNTNVVQNFYWSGTNQLWEFEVIK